MRIAVFTLLMALCAPTAVQAEPAGGRVTIVSIRPYSGGWICLQVPSNDLCGTEVFSFTESEVNGKEMYAVAMTALVTGKQVQLEARGCNGWDTLLQSIYIYR